MRCTNCEEDDFIPVYLHDKECGSWVCEEDTDTPSTFHFCPTCGILEPVWADEE